ncbi:MAG: ABC transporter ATP-binding protein [Clostridiales Family XIII bacterium]|jgi:ABC-2 type transport system ATP-binding protein|nr:ABC transporter ATP-binding protein [Clostridiales Family XIII bacterium]
MDAISLKNVHISFGKAQILKGVSLSVMPGGIYGLLGPSGSGKTTTVKIIVGILKASVGEVVVLEEIMPSFVAMKSIGYMAQENALYEDLTGQQNLEFFGAMYGLSGKNLENRIKQSLNFIDLSGEAKKLVSKYSGGMKRRLALAAAILHAPKVLILDEPTVGIDPVLRRSIWRGLYKIAQTGTAILITTHVMDEAEKCQRLAMMREGRIIGEGTPEELKAHYGCFSIEDVFLRLSTEKDEARR